LQLLYSGWAQIAEPLVAVANDCGHATIQDRGYVWWLAADVHRLV
jgi:hypothetical protein